MISGVIEILIEDAGIIALPGIKNAADNKIKVYPVIAPQPENQPYITAAQSSVNPTSYKGQKSLLDYPQVDIICWAKNFRDAEVMRDTVRLAIDEKSATTDAGYVFLRIYLVNARDAFDNAAQLYACIATYGIEEKIAP